MLSRSRRNERSFNRKGLMKKRIKNGKIKAKVPFLRTKTKNIIELSAMYDLLKDKVEE